MPYYIVLRLTPAAAIKATPTFSNYLTGLKVNVYDVSFAGTGSIPLGSASYPGNIVQHIDSGPPLAPASVATAVILVPATTPEYVSPNIQIEFVRGTLSVRDPNIYYEVTVLNAASAPLPPQYQAIPPSSISAYVTLPAPPPAVPSIAAPALQLPSNGNPPNYGDLLTAINAVLTKDPGATAPAIANLTLDQCQTIANEIAYGPQPPLPTPPDDLGYMYTSPTNDGSPNNPNQQALSAFQGSLTSYYAQNNATAAQLTNFVFSLAAAQWCEWQSKVANSAILSFPVYPNQNPAAPATNATASEAEIILTVPPTIPPAVPPTVPPVTLGIDVPAQYFYALAAQLPPQMTPPQRFAAATGADQAQNLSQLTNAVNAGWITVLPPAMSPAQAARALSALNVPAASTVTTCDISLPSMSSIKQIWTDWLAFPSAAWPWSGALPAGYTYQAGDDLTYFWPTEATNQSPAFLDLVLWVLTEGWFDTTTGQYLAPEIKANLVVAATSSHINYVGDLALASPSDWQTFFGPPPPPNTVPGNLPLFTLPGSFTTRVAAFIRHVQSFFGVQSVAPNIPTANPTAPPSLNLPASDLISQTMTAAGFAFSSSLTLTTLTNAAAAVVPPLDPQAQAWAVQAIWTLNQLHTLANVSVNNLPASPSLQFSVMEALYARGFTSADDVLDLPPADFQQALTGTVAYDFAAQIHTNAGAPHVLPKPDQQTFIPINPGSLTDCVPPLCLSPLGPIAYLQEMLKVSEGATCENMSPAPITLDLKDIRDGTVLFFNSTAGVTVGMEVSGTNIPENTTVVSVSPAPAHTVTLSQATTVTSGASITFTMVTLGSVITQRRGPLGNLAASGANCETPLPLIDIVNECLEYAASTAGTHGTIYNTAEDVLAGHTLCVEECCTEQEKNDAACHDPATLFAALPQYSTPGTPSPSGALVRLKTGGFSNSEVEPAVYDILKADFSSCCLPYSQALDVSRTYLEHFRSCRFEVMRTFRKCITEFVLDPNNPPAGFKSYLWRYPVRIDIAIEYLGITPEEYVALFGGVWPDPCDTPCYAPVAGATPATLPTQQLYGFSADDRAWTETVVQLPEFLKRTCLTYCEFLELWKTGFVKFSKAGDPAGPFPDCEPCCLEELQLTFPEQGEELSEYFALTKLAVFIRLWHKLKRLCGGDCSFQQLADICTVLPLFNGNAVNPDFIRQLAALQMLRDQLRLPLTDEHAAASAGAAGADRTFLLSLWAGTGRQWDWALQRFIAGIAHYAACRYGCERREPEFLKQLADNFDCLSRLAGFDPATVSATWHTVPTHTLRFAEILAKIYASHFSIGEVIFLFAADDSLYGEYGHEKHEYGDEPEHEKHEHEYDDKHEHEKHEHAYDEHDHDDEEHERDERDEREHEHEHEHERSPWQLRRKLLEKHVPREETEDWTWSRLESALHHEFGFAGEHPSLQRQQAMFDCWERVFDYDRVRNELGGRFECHLRYFQDQTVPVYALTTDDLEDDRWMVRAGHADRWIRSLSHCFRIKDLAQARPELWAADDPAALVAGETETGNANLSRFLGDGCLEAGAPRLYDDLRKLNDGLRERGRDALVAYLCGVNGIKNNGIKKTPKELSDQLLLDVETGCCEKASRIEEAITAVQTFVQRCRIGLEAGWKISPQFAHMWDSRFASYHVWQACKRRELYKENLIDWHELEKATKIESFRFMDEELRRVSLTIAAPGGVDYWPEHRPPAPGLCLLQERDPATMQLLSPPPPPAVTREGLGLLATPERDGRPSWVTTAPRQNTAASGGTAATSTSGTRLHHLPIWMEAAIKLDTRFVRVAAAGHPPASTPFEPWKSSRPAGSKEESCVECCTECGCRHPAHVDEYYFWLVDGRHFDPHDAQRFDKNTPSSYTYDAQQNSYYDPGAQESTPWHDPTKLPNLLEWSSKPMVRLAWCRVHNGEFWQQRISDHGIDVSTATAPADLSFQGRSGDSIFFQVTNVAPIPPVTPGFRYDMAADLAYAQDNMVFPPPPPAVAPPGGLMAYPYFAYFSPGARLFPWSPYSPAIAVANSLRAHCRFESALKWYDLFYDPLTQDNTWAKCLQDKTSQLSPQPTPQPSPQPQPTPPPQPATAAPVVAATPVVTTTPAVPVAATPAATATPAGPVAVTPADPVPGVIAAPANNATTTCCDSTDVSCHVARQRSVLLHYLETLVEWGDALMRRDSPEQFQQARVIFDSARTILGPRPHKVANPATVNPPAATVATFIPLFAPINPRLMMLYDRLDDRMALIHDCLDKRRLRQASERRDAQYWGRDPVRDGWRSERDHCCDEAGWCHPHSPYRFTFLIQKAKELANQTRELGGALLAAFEKGDAEYLASMRAVHERELLALGRKVREGEWRDADFQVQALQKTKESDQASRRYYANLIANGLISNEKDSVTQTKRALQFRDAGNISEAIGQLMVVIPDVWLSAVPATQIPVGTKLAGLFSAIARVLNVIADNASTTASLDLTEAGWDRRLQDWIHQVQILDIQIEQVELQILGAERRRGDSLRQLNNQQRQIEQSTEVMSFLRDKFTNHAVYLFLQKNTADLHYRMYELALSAAREAERAFHFERGHDTRRFVSCEGWDNLHEGLLAGERLQLSLAQMEKDYCDRNRREYELTKHISLRLQFPAEFLRLKLTGRCEIDLAEWRFDLDYPGHFMRRIKNATITIPAVSGPYNGVHCRLTLMGSSTRVDPLLSLAPAHCCNTCKSGNGYEACPHDPRIVRQYAATEAIATSSAQNDSGLFELNFHDDRYLPFEFHGAVSKWCIELPPDNNYFDMDTLSDVIVHLNYTAREGGVRLRHAAKEAAEKRLPGAGWCLFDVSHDFPDAWELSRTNHDEKQHGDHQRGDKRTRHLNLKFGRDLFPFIPGHRELRIDKMALLFDTCEKPDRDCCAGECACGEDKIRACWRVGFKGHRGECEEIEICCAASEDWSDLYYGVVDTRMGALGRNGDRQEARLRFSAEVGELSKVFLLCRYEVASPCLDK